jgi:hypothetical protein
MKVLDVGSGAGDVALLLGGVNLEQLSPEAYRLVVSTLRLVLLPEAIRVATEG